MDLFGQRSFLAQSSVFLKIECFEPQPWRRRAAKNLHASLFRWPKLAIVPPIANGMLGGIPNFWTSSHNSVDHMAESLPQCLTIHFNHVTPIAETSPSIYFWKTPTPIISRLGSKCTTVPHNCRSTCSPTTQHGRRVQQMKRQLWLAWKPNWMAGRQTNRLTNKIFTV